jgi:hypothetical protein
LPGVCAENVSMAGRMASGASVRRERSSGADIVLEVILCGEQSGVSAGCLCYGQGVWRGLLRVQADSLCVVIQPPPHAG